MPYIYSYKLRHRARRGDRIAQPEVIENTISVEPRTSSPWPAEESYTGVQRLVEGRTVAETSNVPANDASETSATLHINASEECESETSLTAENPEAEGLHECIQLARDAYSSFLATSPQSEDETSQTLELEEDPVPNETVSEHDRRLVVSESFEATTPKYHFISGEDVGDVDNSFEATTSKYRFISVEDVDDMNQDVKYKSAADSDIQAKSEPPGSIFSQVETNIPTTTPYRSSSTQLVSKKPRRPRRFPYRERGSRCANASRSMLNSLRRIQKSLGRNLKTKAQNEMVLHEKLKAKDAELEELRRHYSECRGLNIRLQTRLSGVNSGYADLELRLAEANARAKDMRSQQQVCSKVCQESFLAKFPGAYSISSLRHHRSVPTTSSICPGNTSGYNVWQLPPKKAYTRHVGGGTRRCYPKCHMQEENID